MPWVQSRIFSKCRKHWNFTLYPSSIVTSIFNPRQSLQSLEILKQISYVLIKQAIPRKLVKISDWRVSKFLKTVSGCRVSRHFLNYSFNIFLQYYLMMWLLIAPETNFPPIKLGHLLNILRLRQTSALYLYQQIDLTQINRLWQFTLGCCFNFFCLFFKIKFLLTVCNQRLVLACHIYISLKFKAHNTSLYCLLMIAKNSLFYWALIHLCHGIKKNISQLVIFWWKTMKPLSKKSFYDESLGVANKFFSSVIGI